ncbi:ATP-binding protein [Streptomyces taklimakanensis]
MDEWGWPPESEDSCTVALLVGELTANAVRHGRVPGRDFRLRLTYEAPAGTVRVEVSDASSDRPPIEPFDPSCDDESGRGLYLVDVLADRWGVAPREPAGSVGKTVWAEATVAPPAVTAARTD